MACAICKTRREKRECPGVHGSICAICCGEQREETVDCPFECEYLRNAHHHEALAKKDPAGMPSPEIRLTNEFLRKNFELVTLLQLTLLRAALERSAVDADAKEALDGIVRTYKTLESGLYYDSRPTNSIAGAIFDALQQHITELRRVETERGLHKITDHQILLGLVLMQQMEYAFDNGRKMGRCFLHQLRISLAEMAGQMQPDPGQLIVS